MFDLNLKRALKKDRDKLISTRELESIIDKFYKRRITINKEVELGLNQQSDLTSNKLIFDKLESENIFHIDSIKKLCIKYRLRFLDTSLFMGDYPSELYNIIPRLEKIHDTKFKNFKIMAPSRLFRLRVKEDPLLFIPMGNGYYYLVYKWGKDLKTYRKILVWPFKNINTLIFSSVILSLISTAFWGSIFNTFSDIQLFVIFIFNIKTFVFVTFYLLFMMRKNFNESIWNSKYKN